MHLCTDKSSYLHTMVEHWTLKSEKIHCIKYYYMHNIKVIAVPKV